MAFQFASKSKQPAQHKSSPPPSRTVRSTAPVHPVLQLQRTIGNLGVLRLLECQRTQPKCACGGSCPDCAPPSPDLKISDPGDKHEREADHVADEIVRIPDAQIQRQEAEASRPAPSSPRGNSAPGIVGAGGRPLPDSGRNYFEPRFGHGFSQVRIHTDPHAADSAKDLGARAYTIEQNIVFNAGEFSPDTLEGRRLLAHELTHVVQQSECSGPESRFVQRKPDPTKPEKTKSKPKRRTKKRRKRNPGKAGDAPKLEFTPARKGGTPCACLIVIHNDEQSARETAKTLHKQCFYNLALLNSGTDKRRVKLPGENGDVDPNELFPSGIAQECLKDPKACEKRLKDDTGATEGKAVRRFVQTQFFSTLKECSDSFKLPVVALHNNVISDTVKFIKKKKRGILDPKKLELDVGDKKTKKGTTQLGAVLKQLEKDGLIFKYSENDIQEKLLLLERHIYKVTAATLKRLKKAKVPEDVLTGLKTIKDRRIGGKDAFRKAVADAIGGSANEKKHRKLIRRHALQMTLLRKGNTNIFRWCVSTDLNRCHIGDPARPDHVIWATNVKDFNELSKTKVNVALQTDVPASQESESASDLSTLFVALEKQFGFALQDDNPFVFLLIVPEVVGAGLAGGDNPLDTDVFVFGEDFNEFLGKIGRQVGEEVVHRCADAPVTAAFINSFDSLANCFCFRRTYG